MYHQNILNIQSVLPFELNQNWNLITRWIMPVVYQPALFGDNPDFGLGDFNPSFFFATTAGSCLWSRLSRSSDGFRRVPG